jgi:Leucine-rich repeat (LRR) protein
LENTIFLVLDLALSTTLTNFRACCSGADDNSLNEFKPHGILPRLRILRLSANRLKCLDASHFPNLRVLYIDNNSLTEFKKANRLCSLENLSLRNQAGNAL